jgi:UDP-GlcNAc:undecaprenyl-phosphate GlcNAc-1-phosphate transferase
MLITTLCFGVLVLAACGFAEPFGRLLGVMDHPDDVRKHHARPTPMVGGIALMAPLVPVTIAEVIRIGPQAQALAALAAAGLAFGTLGWFDDRHHVAPVLRLLISAALCTLLLLIEPTLRLETLAFGSVVLPLSWLAIPFTVLCLVGLQNAINMADGLNGLVVGLCLVWTLCLLAYAPAEILFFLYWLAIGLAIVFVYNVLGRLFLGDAGSYALGIIMGLAMVHVEQVSPSLPMATVVLWLAAPVLDCLRVMVARQLADRSPLAADRNHLHHRLERIWGSRVAVALYLALVGVPSLLAAWRPEATALLLPLSLLGYVGLIWRTRPGRSAAGSAAAA